MPEAQTRASLKILRRATGPFRCWWDACIWPSRAWRQVDRRLERERTK